MIKDSAGSIMTLDYVELKKSMTIGKAMASLKTQGMSKDTIYTLYVTNEEGVLEGIIPLRVLVTSDLNKTIEEKMYKDIIQVNIHDDQEDVADVFKKYDFLAVPVVDDTNHLAGIITVDNIIDVIEQESTEDFQLMAGIRPYEEEYLKSSVFTLSKQRFTWLLILMVSATFTGSIISKYESMIQSVVVLTTFIPMFMDTGGNAGSQSSTLIIRGLALGEIEIGDYLKVFFKELKVSALVGLSLAGVNFIRVYFLQKISFDISMIVTATLLLTVVLAKILGGLLPLIAKKLKLDPAIMAGPLITTIVDASSLIFYFYIASTILHL